MQDYHIRAKHGIKLLMGRQVCLQALTFGGGVILARVLGPAQFGLYAIATFLVSTFALLGDIGLAPSFIQRKEELTDRDLCVAFTLQQGLTTLIVSLLLLTAPWLVALYPKAPPHTVWLVRTLALSLYLTSWRSMSALQLERQLCYDKLAKIEVVETLSYQGIAVVMALAGYGVWSFVWATLMRGLLGTALVYRAAPWQLRFGFDRDIARGILRFGIPFQLQNFANQAGSWVSPLLVGSLIGPQAVGFLTWATSNGKKPLILVDNVMRVAFPHFSRIQEDRREVERVLMRYLTLLLLAIGFWFVVLLILGGPLVRLIYTDKWTPAVPALVVCAGTLVFDAMMWMVSVTLNSLGMVKFTTKLVLLRSIIFVVGSIPLVVKFGFIGVPLAFFLGMAVTTPWLFSGFGRGAFLRLTLQLTWLLAPVFLGAFAGEVVCKLLPPGKASLLFAIIAIVLAYAGATWVLCPQWIKQMIASRIGKRGPVAVPAVDFAKS